MKLLRAYVRLPPGLRATVAKAAILAAFVEPAVRVMRLPALAKLLGLRIGRGAPAPSQQQPDEDLRRAVKAVDLVYRRWARPRTCLRRSLVLGALMRRRHPVLHIGVRRTATVGAHAWLEIGGVVVGDDPSYVPLR